MNLRGVLGNVMAGMAALIGNGGARQGPIHRRESTVPLAMPARRTSTRYRKGRKSPEARRLKHERRKASIPARVWHTGPVRTFGFQHERRSDREYREALAAA